MKKKIKGESFNIKKFLIAIFSLMFLLFFIFYFIHQLKNVPISFTIKKGRLAEEELVKAIFVRKEEVLGENGTKKRIEKIKEEGSRVAKGEDVFRYYSEDKQNIIKQIDDINTEINKYIQSQKINLNSPNNEVINKYIRDVINNMTNTTSQAKNKEMTKDIINKLQEKAKDGELFKYDENIKRLNKEKSDLESKLTLDTKMVTAPFAGMVSYKIDGFENKLKVDTIEQFNSENLKKLNIKNNIQIPKSETNGKVVDNFEMYILAETNNKEASIKKVGDYIKIRVQGNVINAEIIKLPNDDRKNDKVIILKITENVEKLIDNRSMQVDLIWWEKEGLKVSNKAIEEEKGFHFIIKNKWTYREKIIVKIVKKTEEFSLVENYTSEELKELGIDITKVRPNVQDGDEIVIISDKEKNKKENTIKVQKMVKENDNK